jgi:8-oxo-dGTP pyrophosphatase MutT (NUDIX family)
MAPTPPESPDKSARLPLPRPPDHRPGAPAPWADLPPSARRGLTLDRVRALPFDTSSGENGWVEPWRDSTEMADFRRAAVLVALFEEANEARVVLTVRSTTLRSHRGEVAFPGGGLESGEGVVEAALREAEEEVGLDPKLVTVLGQLGSRPTLASNSVMTPVVGTLTARPTLQASPAEVDRVFDVALSDLVADGVFTEELWSVPGRRGVSGVPGGEFPVWFFDVAGETVWGATARTLVELLCSVLGVPLPASLRRH